MGRAVLLFSIAFFLPVATFGDGHDMSEVRYVSRRMANYFQPPYVTPFYDGTNFVTAAAVYGAGYGVYIARTDPSNGATSVATPIGRLDPPGFLETTWFTHGFMAVATDPTTLVVTDLRTGQRSVLSHDAATPKIAANGRLIVVADRNGFVDLGGKFVTVSTFLRDGTLLARVTLPPADDFDVESAGDGFNVATAGERSGVHLFHIDASAAVVADQLIANALKGGPFRVSLASAGDQTVVAWTLGSGLGYVASVSAAGVASSPQRLPAVTSAGTFGARQVLAMRIGFAVVGNLYEPRAAVTTAAIRLDPSGQIVDATPTIIVDRPFVAAASSSDVIAVVAAATSSRPELTVTTAVPREGGFDVRPEAAVLVPAMQEHLKIASDGVDFVGVWYEEEGVTPVLKAGRVTRSGVPLDGPGVKLPFQPHVPSYDISLAIARGASGEALIVAAGAEGVYAVRWSRSVGVLDPAPIVLSRGRSTAAALAFNGTRYLVFWSTSGNGLTQDEVLGRFVGRDGALSEPVDVPALRFAGPPDKYPEHPELAWDGREFLLAMSMASYCFIEGCLTPLPPEIRLVRLSAAGMALDDRAAVVPGVHTAARVASSGTEFLVALDDGTFRIVHTSGDGIEIGAERRFFEPPTGSWTAFDVVWEGTAYVIAWMSTTASGFPSWLESVRTDKAGEVSAVTYVRTGAASVLSAAANDLGESALAIAEVTPQTETSRARIYFPRDFAFVPSPPSAPRSLVSHLIGTSAVLMWESDAADGFVIEGPWGMVVTVDGTSRQTTVEGHPRYQFRIRSFGPGGVSAAGPITTVASEPRVRSVRR